jgi:hypothetical protein
MVMSPGQQFDVDLRTIWHDCIEVLRHGNAPEAWHDLEPRITELGRRLNSLEYERR